MSDYVRKVTAWITAEQDAKIRESGLKDSDFIREAIDEKDYQFPEMKARMEKALLDDMIQYLSDKRGGNCQTSCQTNHPKMGENVRQLYQELVDCQTNLSDKQGEIVRQNPSEVFGNSLQTIVNLLHANGKLTPKQTDVISSKLGVTSKELKDLIVEYHDDLLQMSPCRG